MPGDAGAIFMANFLFSQLFYKAPYPTQSFAGQTIIITGSNTGLGFEAVKHVIRLGATKVIIAVRSVEKGQTAKESIVRDLKCDANTVEVWQMDLASYDSVKAFAERASKELDRLDVLLENAGVGNQEWQWEEDNERHITINVVSTFLLAFMLLPKMRETAQKFKVQPHLTVVTSDTHFTVDFDEKDAKDGIFKAMNDKSQSNVPDRYPTSKLIQVFIIRELAARLSAAAAGGKTPIVVNCVNPGLCQSELSRDVNGIGFALFKMVFARTTEQGSRVLVHGAAGGEDTHGQYMNLGAVEAPATLVTGPRGAELQTKLYTELMEKLDKLVPRVSANVKA
jgi:NAD(P)-dependent dehydrogenase (short-subunit alcohol dehydrogenase family)